MTFEPSPKQALVLWSLVVATPGEETSRSKVKPDLSATERTQLLSAGFIEEERRGRATHLLLSDKGWEWAEAQDQHKFSRSTYSTIVLEKLIQALSRYLARNDVRLAEVIATLHSPEESPPQPTGAETTDGLGDQIRRAYLSLTGGEVERRVRLSHLRPELPSVSRGALDETLIQMDRSRAIQLMTLEQPSDITAEDNVAAISIAGRPMHILYLPR